MSLRLSAPMLEKKGSRRRGGIPTWMEWSVVTILFVFLCMRRGMWPAFPWKQMMSTSDITATAIRRRKARGEVFTFIARGNQVGCVPLCTRIPHEYYHQLNPSFVCRFLWQHLIKCAFHGSHPARLNYVDTKCAAPWLLNHYRALSSQQAIWHPAVQV